MGDCAAVPDAKTGGPQPPTAQHALDRRGTQRRTSRRFSPPIEKALPLLHHWPARVDCYRRGVSNILGMNFSGFIAWLLWRSFYLLKLPRLTKKTRVALSWLLEMIFSKDSSRC